MTADTTRSVAAVSKGALRKLIPNFVLRERDIIRRLGPDAGWVYARLRGLDMVGVRTASRRLVPSSARSFVFVCYGNIMRSAMAEFLMRQALSEAGLEQQVRIVSAGLHACAGREAHLWAQQASAELGISLAEHRAQLLSRDMVVGADCLLAMDFQNQAELRTRYPDAHGKIYMLSAYADRPWRFRQIPDPFLGNLETTRFCSRQLRTCVRHLISSIFPGALSSDRQKTADPKPVQC